MPHNRTIEATAARLGLKVTTRVTTGTRAKGFATFELSGGDWQTCRTCVEELTAAGFSPTVERVDVKENPEYGRPFVEIQSVWFDNTPAAEPSDPETRLDLPAIDQGPADADTTQQR